jgi:hypothetical protein
MTKATLTIKEAIEEIAATGVRPSAEQVDSMCLKVDTAAAEAEAAAERLKKVKEPLLAAVRAFGSVPETAPRTRRLAGTLYVADSTVNTKTDIVDSAVADLRSKLKEHRKSVLFDQLFETIESFALLKDAAELLKIGIGGLPEPRQAEILGLYAQCFNANTSKPSLSVDLLTVLREREAKAEEKAAKKAARAAKPAKKGGSK